MKEFQTENAWFSLKWWILVEKMRDFRVKWGILKEKTRDFNLDGGFLKWNHGFFLLK